MNQKKDSNEEVKLIRKVKRREKNIGDLKINRKGRKERKGFDFLNREDRKKDKGRG